MLKHQKNEEANQELKKQIMNKLEKRKIKEAEEEIERKCQQHTIESIKKLDMEWQTSKQKETQQQKEFLRVNEQNQIKSKKMLQKFRNEQ